ncbi:hypothetical protein, partial [Nocardia nova]|uniref:hypothetical protein n=1 Tax=Nocardia nova TaxID=37330 RepID=UPI001E310B93
AGPLPRPRRPHRRTGGPHPRTDRLIEQDHAEITPIHHPLGLDQFVLDRLVADDVIRYLGQSRTGTDKYEVVQTAALTESEMNEIAAEYTAATPSDEPVFPSAVARSPFPAALLITDEPPF